MPRLEYDENGNVRISIELGSNQLERFNSQIGRLNDLGVSVSVSAAAFILLAIESIASDPAQFWPEYIKENHSERTALQDTVIDGLGFNLLTFAQQLNRTYSTKNIGIFEAIERANDSVIAACVDVPRTRL